MPPQRVLPDQLHRQTVCTQVPVSPRPQVGHLSSPGRSPLTSKMERTQGSGRGSLSGRLEWPLSTTRDSPWGPVCGVMRTQCVRHEGGSRTTGQKGRRIAEGLGTPSERGLKCGQRLRPVGEVPAEPGCSGCPWIQWPVAVSWDRARRGLTRVVPAASRGGAPSPVPVHLGEFPLLVGFAGEGVRRQVADLQPGVVPQEVVERHPGRGRDTGIQVTRRPTDKP